MLIKKNFVITQHDKKLIIAAAGLFILALVLFLTLPNLVDTKAIQTELKTTFKRATGLDLEIQNSIEVSIFPTPHVKMRNLYVSNIPGAASSFLLSVRSLDIKLRPSSLFSARPTAESIAIDGVVLELERMKNGRMNWQEMKQYTASTSTSALPDASTPAIPSTDTTSLDTTSNTKGNAEPNEGMSVLVAALSKTPNISLSNGDIHFTDSQVGIISNYSDISIKFNNDIKAKQSKLLASINYGDFPLSITAEMGEIGQSYALKTTSAKVRLESDRTFLNYEGEISASDNLALKGKAEFESKDITRWIRLLNGYDVNNEKLNAGLKPVPLKLVSDVTTEGNRILFPSIASSGGIFDGTLQAVLRVPFTWDVKGTFDNVDMDTIVASGVFLPDASSKQPKRDAEDETALSTLNMVSKKSLWSYLTFSVDLRAKDINYNHQHISKGHLEFDMSDGDMAISQTSGVFPGGSKLLFTGLGKEGYQGFMVDGQLDGSGENFMEMVSFFKKGESTMLPADFKRFRFKTNMVLSSKEMRFTELTSRIENMAFVGGIITTFGNRTKIQSAMRIGGIDLDRFFMLWGVNKFRDVFTSENLNTVRTEDDISIWLKGLGYDLDMRASVEKYTLGGKEREKCKFRVSATKNKIAFNEIEMSYNDTQFAGKALLDVSDTLPFIDVDIAGDTLDISSYIGQKNWLYDTPSPNNPKASGPLWSHKGLNFHWLDFINATFRFKLGQLKNGEFEATAIETKGSLENRSLNISSLFANIQGAQVTGKALVKGGKIPSATFTGDVSSLDVINLIGFMPALQGMSGKYNAHFRFNTNGIDVFTWVYNLEGAIAISARDITVDGFNLPGIVSAVGYVRTVADILDAVKRAFPGGSTVFTNIEGEWTVGSGVFKTASLRLKNELAEAEFAGQVDIINWKMVGHIVFSLVYLDRVNPPKMAINYTGVLDAIEKELDTRLLEQYVANRTSEKLLNQSDSN